MPQQIEVDPAQLKSIEVDPEALQEFQTSNEPSGISFFDATSGRTIPVFRKSPQPPGAFGFNQPPTDIVNPEDAKRLEEQSKQQPSAFDTPGETFLREAIVNPARQWGAVGEQSMSQINKVLENTLRALDQYSTIFGGRPGELYQHAADWLGAHAQAQEQRSAELAAGRKDLPSVVNRVAAGVAANYPLYAATGAVAGPIKGMALLGGLENLDKGWLATAQGIAEGATVGKMVDMMGPYGRKIRVPVNIGYNWALQKAHGVDDETAWANALAAGGMSVPGEGKAGFRDIQANLENLPTNILQTTFGSKLDPVKQGAVNFFREEGVPMRAGTQTGNKYLRAMEQHTAHTPLGSQFAEEFDTGTAEGIGGLSERLAERAHPQPQTPYSAGQFSHGNLEKQIADLNLQEQEAYGTAWERANDPSLAEKVAVRNKPKLDASGKPTGEMEPVYKNVIMPVDVGWMQDLAKKQLPKYEYGLSTQQLEQSKAYGILQKIKKGDRYISAEQAEEALKGLKGESRKADDPNLRNVSEGLAASLIPRLQMAIDNAVGKAGEAAKAGLQSGRKLHADKMRIAEIRDLLNEAPVKAFTQLTGAKDTNVHILEQLVNQVPQAGEVLGRAWLEQTFEKATQEGGWARSLGILREWQNLGSRTKAKMFPNAEMRQNLDRFFLAQKMVADQINTSGTESLRSAKEATTFNILKWASGHYGGKLFYTPRGISLLTGILEKPPQTAADIAKVKARATEIGGK